MDVSQHITTVEEKNELLSELQELLKNSDNETVISSVERSTSSHKGALQEIIASGDPRKEISATVENLKMVSKVEIVVSRKLDRSIRSKIKDWFMTHVGTPVVLDISHDPSVLAGAQITYNGRYYDGSIAEKVDAYLTSSRVREVLFAQ